MADTGNAILSHYKIESLFPDEWPSSRDAEDSSEDEGLLPAPKPQRVASRSRYSVLEPKRSSVPGAERTKEGIENLVQRDEPDPLGQSSSVIQTLRRQGVDIDADSKLKNKYLLSSTTFSPTIFLSQVHQDATTDDLLRGLNFLSQSIEKKSASLKVLVESNFEKFVRAKATIDNVYREMVNPGQDANGPPPTARKPHSRQTSRQSVHLRKGSGPFSPGFAPEKRKNALVKEQEYGILPLKIPLLELKAKVDEVWGPALGGKDREANLNVFMAATQKQRGVFDIGGTIAECIKRRENDALVEEYGKARRLADDARKVMESAALRDTPLSDPDIVQIVMTARMWSDVEDQIEGFKRDVWRRLAGTHFNKHAHEDNRTEEYMELIKVLLELGVEDNPIWVWLYSRYDYLKQKITNNFERSKVEIEILRRRLSYNEHPTPSQVATHLKSATTDGRVRQDVQIDSPKVIEVWEHIYSCLNTLLSTTQGGILGEVIEFWETARSFIDGKAQQTLPSGIDGGSRKHHRLSADGITMIAGGAQELINLVRESILSFFTDPPTEDLSLLLSPVPPTPLTPKTPRTPKSAILQTFSDNRFRIDTSNVPPPSPRKGDSWEKYAFWPPHANSLSGVHYLSKIIHLIGTASCDMAGLQIVEDRNQSMELFKVLVGNVRERCVQAACAAWGTDCDQANVLEDWTRSPERADLTNFPSHLMNFEGFLLQNLQRILYISEATRRPSSPDIIVPPSSKLLQMVRSQFVGGIYKVINGMKDNAEFSTNVDDAGSDGLIKPLRKTAITDSTMPAVDSSNKNVRLLLTLSNIQGLRNDIMPHLITMFETNFTIKLTDETNSIRDALAKIDSRLFQAYVTPLVQETDSLVRSSIARSDWAPVGAPTDARPYVYTVLLGLVLVHTEVSTTTAPLTSPILKHLLEKYLVSFLEAFKARPKYNLQALMQATLDVEFMAQMVSNYITKNASTTQGELYVQLDQLTDQEVRGKLQQELKELRNTLKTLRESTKTEFACFKRPRTGTRTGERPSVSQPPTDR